TPLCGTERRRGALSSISAKALLGTPRARHDAWVGGVDAIDVGVDVAALGVEGGGDRHGRGVGAAAAQRGETLGVLVDALEARDHRDLVALLEALEDLLAVDVED